MRAGGGRHTGEAHRGGTKGGHAEGSRAEERCAVGHAEDTQRGGGAQRGAQKGARRGARRGEVRPPSACSLCVLLCASPLHVPSLRAPSACPPPLCAPSVRAPLCAPPSARPASAPQGEGEGEGGRARASRRGCTHVSRRAGMPM